ncbi:MAG: hypothetical protein V3U35_01540, partial [Candidatus Neomarinimicrobiota bacterium]
DQYYRDLMTRSHDPDVLDSLQATLPRHYTRSGRVVYGGGGIMPDETIPWELKLTDQTLRLLNNPERLFYQYAEQEALGMTGKYADVGAFMADYRLGEAGQKQLKAWLVGQDEEVDDALLEQDWAYISNLVASEVAGLLWDRSALFRVRLERDNQIQEALKHFGQAQDLLALR